MIALITGATSGIGKSVAYILAQHKYDLIITGRRAERLNELKNNLGKEYNIKVQSLCFDIRQQEACEQALNTLPSEWKLIDVLVNNAGLAAGLAPINAGDVNDWETMIDTNIKGLLYVSKIVSNWMIERKKGHIVNVGSIAGKEAYANGNVYCATKHAVDALNKTMRIDLLPYGIKVSSINPGMVETEFSLVRFKGDSERAKQVYKGFNPLTPNDVAESIWWMINRPANVNINEMTIMATYQANSTTTIRQE